MREKKEQKKGKIDQDWQFYFSHYNIARITTHILY